MKQQVKSENALTHSIHQINSHRVMLSLKYLLEKRVSRNAFVGITRILASENVLHRKSSEHKFGMRRNTARSDQASYESGTWLPSP